MKTTDKGVFFNVNIITFAVILQKKIKFV